MDKIITIRMNGRPVRARAGQTVMEAARSVGIDIPSLCHHPAVTPTGGLPDLPGGNRTAA